MKPLLILSLAALLAACASPPAAEQTVAANGADVVCAREVRTGSMFANQRCRSAAQRDEDQREASRVGDMVRPAAVSPASGGS